MQARLVVRRLAQVVVAALSQGRAALAVHSVAAQ